LWETIYQPLSEGKMLEHLRQRFFRVGPEEPLPPGPPVDAYLYDCDGFPVSSDREGGTRAWEGHEPRPVRRQFLQSEGVSIDRERFDELRRLLGMNGYRDPFA
jgi:hypothetical protein